MNDVQAAAERLRSYNRWLARSCHSDPCPYKDTPPLQLHRDRVLLSDAACNDPASLPLIQSAPELLAACEAALPWVAIAIAGRIDPHPQAVKNHAEDLARLRAAIKKAKGK